MPVPRFAVELARATLATTAFTAAVNHATVYDPAGAVEAGYLDRIVAEDVVVNTAIAHATDLAERLRPSAFVQTRRNCRADTVELLHDLLVNDLATFVVEIPAD
jgi:enoyl-CoA hydratase